MNPAMSSCTSCGASLSVEQLRAPYCPACGASRDQPTIGTEAYFQSRAESSMKMAAKSAVSSVVTTIIVAVVGVIAFIVVIVVMAWQMR